MTNCKNCGAPLRYSKCEYCGTDYDSVNDVGRIQYEIFVSGERVESIDLLLTPLSDTNFYTYRNL